MFNRYKTRGIFLTSKDRGESNRFLTAYTERFGKIKIFAKSIRKKESKLRFGAGFFFLNEIEFIEGRNYRTLTDIKIIDNYENVRKNLTSIAFACKACDDLNVLVKEEEKDERTWSLLENFFKDLNQNKKYLPEFMIYFRFIWKLFSFSGYNPELYHCVFCSKKIERNGIFFSFQEGGIVGNCCFQKEKDFFLVSENVIKTLRILINEKESIISKLKIDSQTKKELENLTEKYLKHLTG